MSCSAGKYITAVWEGEFESANKTIEKRLDKDPFHAEANIAKAWFYYLQSNGNLNHLDLAYFYFTITEEAIQLNPKFVNHKIGLNISIIQQLMKEVSLSAYILTDSINTLEAWNHYVKHYSASHLLADALNNRNQLAYREARSRFSLESFRSFLENFPEAEQSDEARVIYQSLLFQTYLEKGTSEAMRKFIQKYPDNPHLSEANVVYQRLVFEEQTTKGNIESYQRFLRNYPESPYTLNAQDSIYRIFTLVGDSRTLLAFIRQFPANRNADAAWLRLFEQETFTFNEDTIEQFISAYPDFPYPELAQHRVEQSKNIPQPKWDEDAERFGYANPHTGEFVIQPQFGDAFPFVEGLAAVSKDSCDDEEEECLYAYMDLEGRLITDFKYSEAGNFKGGVALIGIGNCIQEINCTYGFINRSGREITPVIFAEAYSFSDGLALVQTTNSKYGFIDKNGQTVIPFIYDNANSFSGGLASISFNDLWGFIDVKNNLIVDPKFLNAGDFSEGLAAVETHEGQWGFVNELGQWVIEARYAYAGKFENGQAKVGWRQPSSSPQYPVMIKERTINKMGEFLD